MAGIRAAGAGNWLNMVSDASGGGRRSTSSGRLDRRRRPSAMAHAGLGHRHQPRPLHRLPGDGRPAPVPALARPPATRASSARTQALGHALGRHPDHGRGRRLLVKGSFTTLIVIDVFLLMFTYIPIFIAAIALRVASRTCRGPSACRCPPGRWHLGLFPIAIAIFALFTNGTDYLVGGLVGVLSGPIAYLLVKRFYRGTTDGRPRGLHDHARGLSRGAARADFAAPPYRTPLAHGRRCRRPSPSASSLSPLPSTSTAGIRGP